MSAEAKFRIEEELLAKKDREKQKDEKPRETTVEFLASLAGVLVTGSVITIIGIALLPVAAADAAGGAGPTLDPTLDAADGLDLALERLRIIGLRVEPVAAPMRLQFGHLLKNAPPGGARWRPRCRAGGLRRPAPVASSAPRFSRLCRLP